MAERWEEQQGIASVNCDKAHYGLHSVAVSLPPMCKSHARWVQSGMMLNGMDHSQNAVLPDENEDDGCVTTHSPAGMD